MSTTNNIRLSGYEAYGPGYEDYLNARPRRVRRVMLRTACGCEKIYEGGGIDPSTTIRLRIETPRGQRTADITCTIREFIYSGEFDRDMPVFREVVRPVETDEMVALKRENIKLKSDYAKLHDSVFGMEAGL